jgi:hypothetical protein
MSIVCSSAHLMELIVLRAFERPACAFASEKSTYQ